MQISKSLAAFFIAIVFMSAPAALAQSAKDQAALAALAAADLKHTPAKKLFGAKKLPAESAGPRHWQLCQGLPRGRQGPARDGPAWQVMRLRATAIGPIPPWSTSSNNWPRKPSRTTAGTACWSATCPSPAAARC